MSHLVQLLLPLYRNDGEPVEPAHFDAVRDELTRQFGGMTAYTRAPAEGRWRAGGHVSRDDVVVVEVMVDHLDREWWRRYRALLERRFDQQEIVARAWTVERL
jgi:hypothetical protein